MRNEKSLFSATPSFQLPRNALIAGQQYFLRIRAVQFDSTEPNIFEAQPLENRSVNAVQVVIPTTPAVTATPPLNAFPSGARLWSDLPAFIKSRGQEFSSASRSFFDSLATRLEPFFSNPTVKEFADVSADVITLEAALIDIIFAHVQGVRLNHTIFTREERPARVDDCIAL